MADDQRNNRTPPAREELVASYKRLLQEYLDRRPSGMRLQIARAMGKHRSFVSQITNPAYSIPIPARHLETIFRICHFSPVERKTFLAAYTEAHPNQTAEKATPARKASGARKIEIELPSSGDAKFDEAVDEIVKQFAKQIAKLGQKRG
ncbi:hypothetical protein [Hypericibacter sp.]|uniref:hypothetical protein n=1 Tax=Hypericibacter sp. TaxID=2705401 RepID=UPI003D6C8B55